MDGRKRDVSLFRWSGVWCCGGKGVRQGGWVCRHTEYESNQVHYSCPPPLFCLKRIDLLPGVSKKHLGFPCGHLWAFSILRWTALGYRNWSALSSRSCSFFSGGKKLRPWCLHERRPVLHSCIASYLLCAYNLNHWQGWWVLWRHRRRWQKERQNQHAKLNKLLRLMELEYFWLELLFFFLWWANIDVVLHRLNAGVDPEK